MITSPVRLSQCNSDVGDSSKNLNSSAKRGRIAQHSGNIALSSMNKSVVGMGTSWDGWYGGSLGTPAGEENRSKYMMSKVGQQDTTGPLTDNGWHRDILHGAARRQDEDAVTEARTVGTLTENGTYRLTYTHYGNAGGSDASADAPGAIAVALSTAGFLEGQTMLAIYELAYDLYQGARTFTKDFAWSGGYPYLTLISYQEVHGPIHQPPGYTQQYAPYYTKWGEYNVRKL